MKRLVIFAVCLLLFAMTLPPSLLAIGGVPGQTSGSSEESSSSWSLRDVPLDVLAGASIFKGETGIALAVRIGLGTSDEGRAMYAVNSSLRSHPSTLSRVSLELGGVLPHQVAGYAEDSAKSVVGSITNIDTARVRTFGEAHAVVLYPLFESPRSAGRPGLTVDAGAGLSIGIVNDEIDIQSNGGFVLFGTPDHSIRPLFSPRLQLGVAAALTDRLSVRIEAAYLNYSNHDSSGVNNFNLGFSGIMIEPLLQFRI